MIDFSRFPTLDPNCVSEMIHWFITFKLNDWFFIGSLPLTLSVLVRMDTETGSSTKPGLMIRQTILPKYLFIFYANNLLNETWIGDMSFFNCEKISIWFFLLGFPTLLYSCQRIQGPSLSLIYLAFVCKLDQLSLYLINMFNIKI